MTRHPPIVAIDGPSGSGKGTISRRLAAATGWHLLDSGALYRLVALAGQQAGLDREDEPGHALVARTMLVEFGSTASGAEKVLLEGSDVTAAIRTETAGEGASRVAAWPSVREALLGRQRRFVEPPGLVADGRDMGTTVFPAAELKVFLTASSTERAARRYKQLKDKGLDVSLAALSREIALRDERDTSRKVSPLAAAPDARIIDSTGLTIDQVVAAVLDLGRQRALWE